MKRIASRPEIACGDEADDDQFRLRIGCGRIVAQQLAGFPRALRPPRPALPIRKLKRAAASRVRPPKSPAEMLMPERLMPGTRANTWARPMPSEPRKVIVSSHELGAPAIGHHRDRTPDHSHHGQGRGRETASSIGPVRSGPTATAGIVATTRSQAILRSGSPLTTDPGWWPTRPE